MGALISVTEGGELVITVSDSPAPTLEATAGELIVSIEDTQPTVVVTTSEGEPGKSAYQLAVLNGFVGSEAAWLASLQGEDGSGSGAWGDLTGTLSDQTDLQSALDAKASTGHDHAGVYAAVGHDHDATYATVGHDHDADYAAISHGHSQGDVTGLTAALAAKADTSHSHAQSDITGLSAALSGKADTGHNHDADYAPIGHDHDSDYAPLAHSHSQSDVTGLTAALAGKSDTSHDHDADYAAISHGHAAGDITGLTKSSVGLGNVDNTSDANKPVSTATQTALDGKANLSGATFSGAISATNVSGTNTGDENYSTITSKLTGGSGGGTSNFLRADGTFAAPPGGGGAAWGSVTGTLSSQTDLQSALDGKAATSHNHDASYVAASHAGAGGTAHANAVAAGAAGFMTGADKTKLDGIASGATANTGTVTSVTITQPAAGITVTSSGTAITTSGTRTIALANDLAAVEALSSTGLVRRTGTDTWTAGTAVALTEVATQAANTFVANGTGSTAAPTAISAATARTILNVANGATANAGTVTTVSVATANGVSGSVATATSTPAITLTLGAITPSSVASSGAISGTTGTFSGVASATNLFQGTKYILSGGKPTSGEVVLADIATSSYTIVQGNCVVKSRVAATGSSVFTFKKDGTTIGTATFAAAATTATVSISSGAITSGQLITIECPATADATLEDIAFLLRV